jgi:hypothetical protein
MPLPLRFTCATLVAVLSLTGCDGSATGQDEEDARRGNIAAARRGDVPLTQALTVPQETMVSDLTEAEFLTFCSISLSVFERIRSRRDDPRYSCVGEGLYARFSPNSDSEVSTCEAARDTCLANSNAYAPPASLTCDESYLALAATCAITLSQYELCLNGIEETMAMIDATLTCDATLDQAFELQALYTSTAPSSCDPIAADCPMLAEVLP